MKLMSKGRGFRASHKPLPNRTGATQKGSPVGFFQTQRRVLLNRARNLVGHGGHLGRGELSGAREMPQATQTDHKTCPLHEIRYRSR